MMKFSEYVAEQKQMLTEAPFIDDANTHAAMEKSTDIIRSIIHDRDNESKSFGAGYKHLEDDMGSIYYRSHNGVPREISYIGNNNVQAGVDKSGGDVTHIHAFMRHHIETHGRLASDSKNTNGSRKLWTDFINGNKDLKFQTVVTDKSGNVTKRTRISHENIDRESPNIWGSTVNHFHTRIVATK